MQKHTPRPYANSDYDRDFNLLYIFVSPTEKQKSGIVKSRVDENSLLTTNLGIYDIGKDQLSHFFDIGTDKLIRRVYYERSYDAENKRMVFNVEDGHIFNNHEIEKREKFDVLFILAWNRKEEIFEFWRSSRLGEDKVLLQTYSEDEKVIPKIDVFNKKVLFIKKLENKVEVEAFEWK